ncbi:hypothetical protein Tco_1074755 [Tanacetum coccineum]
MGDEDIIAFVIRAQRCLESACILAGQHDIVFAAMAGRRPFYPSVRLANLSPMDFARDLRHIMRTDWRKRGYNYEVWTSNWDLCHTPSTDSSRAPAARG